MAYKTSWDNEMISACISSMSLSVSKIIFFRSLYLVSGVDGDVVFGLNDFDEGAIYDFQVDIIRIATSITSHAITNGLDEIEVDHALRVFTQSYLDQILDYKDNEDALLFELTPKTAKGKLKKFLKKVEKKKSSRKQLTKLVSIKKPALFSL